MASNRVNLVKGGSFPEFEAWQDNRGKLEDWGALGAWSVFDYNWPVHYLMYYLAKLVKAKQTLEIGIGRGHATHLMGLHAKEVGGHHTEIDVLPSHANRAVIIRDTFDLPVDILCCDSKAIVWRKRLCLVYVDGGHSYEQVCGDIDNFAPWVRRNGIMIFDDYGKKHHGVTEAVQEKFNPELWEMITWPFCWWAMWRHK